MFDKLKLRMMGIDEKNFTDKATQMAQDMAWMIKVLDQMITVNHEYRDLLDDVIPQESFEIKDTKTGEMQTLTFADEQEAEEELRAEFKLIQDRWNKLSVQKKVKFI